MNLLIASKFCQMCQKAKNDGDRSFYLNTISDHLSKFVEYWQEQFYQEYITTDEADEKMELANLLEEICFNCEFKETGFYNYVKDSYEYYKKIEETTLRVIKKQGAKDLCKKFKMTIEGNVYRSGLFKKRRNKKNL
jgi:hypothetical protein